MSASSIRNTLAKVYLEPVAKPLASAKDSALVRVLHIQYFICTLVYPMLHYPYVAYSDARGFRAHWHVTGFPRTLT